MPSSGTASGGAPLDSTVSHAYLHATCYPKAVAIKQESQRVRHLIASLGVLMALTSVATEATAQSRSCTSTRAGNTTYTTCR
jgi:hypothetical protein